MKNERAGRKESLKKEYRRIDRKIFSPTKCSVCGEKVLETHARVKDDKAVCIPFSEYAQQRVKNPKL